MTHLPRRAAAIFLFTASAMFIEADAAISAAQCTMNGTIKLCKSSFGPGTYTSYGNASGDINRLIIDDPDTSVEPESLLMFFGLILVRLAPRLTPDGRSAALKKLLLMGANDSSEKLRLGDWDWSAIWKENKHLILTAERRK